MPALTLPPPVQPSATSPPGLARRRVWKAPDVRSHSLVVLTLPRLYLAPMTGEPRPETVAAIERGGDLEVALGPLATTIDLAAVRRVRHDLLTNTLHVEYTAGGQRKAKAAVTFATAEAADAAFSKIWRRLGDAFTLTPFRPDPWAVARGPAAIILAIVVFAWLLALGLNALDDLAIARQWELAGKLPGWRTVCGLAGAAAAGATVWLYRRLTRPPERLDLVRSR